MKAKIIIRIVIYLLIIGILSSVLVGFLRYDRFAAVSFGEISSGEEWGELQVISGPGEIADFSGIRDVEIFWISGAVTVCTGNVQSVQLEEKGGASAPMVWKVEDNTLKIRYSREFTKAVNFGINSIRYPEKELILTLPDTMALTDLKIESVNADVHAGGLTLREVELEAVSGNAEFRGCTAENVSLETVSGKLVYTGSLDSLDMDAVSGDCQLMLDNCPSKIDLDTVSGDIDLYLPQDCGFTVNKDSLSGEYHSEFPTQSKGKTHIYQDGTCRIEADGISGDLNIYILE